MEVMKEAMVVMKRTTDQRARYASVTDELRAKYDEAKTYEAQATWNKRQVGGRSSE